jgi:hypothetical protein
MPDTDVMIDCFGLPLVSPQDFGKEQNLVARVHDGLSKSTAHFTALTGSRFDVGADHFPAIVIVLQLLKSRFFDPLGEKPMFHPDLPGRFAMHAGLV